MSFLTPYLASGFDWETLIPIVVFLLYGIGQMFGNRTKETEEAPADSEQVAQEQERARKIQEEIRRKIAERRSQSSAPAEARQQMPEVSTMTTPRTSTYVEPVRPVPRPVVISETQRVGVEEFASFEDQPGVVAMQKHLAEQQRRLRDARAASAQAMRDVYKVTTKKQKLHSYDVKVRGQRLAADGSVQGSVQEEVLELLNNPISSRQGILLAAILGPPAAARSQEPSSKNWF